jgi:hypothetical protein
MCSAAVRIVPDVLAHVRQRPPGLDTETLDHRTVRDADAEAESAAGDLVQVTGRGGERRRVLQIDRLDRRADLQGGGRLGDRQAQPHRIAEARAVDAGKAVRFDVAGEFDRPEAAPRGGSQREGGKT